MYMNCMCFITILLDFLLSRKRWGREKKEGRRKEGGEEE